LSAAGPGPRVLVLSGGLIHLVHQLAVVSQLPELTTASEPPLIGVLITGVLRRDAAALADLHAAIELWLQRSRQLEPQTFAGLCLLREPEQAQAGAWTIACLNSQWLGGQREPVERLDVRELVICGDGLGIYYRCARELRAVLPSLLGLPIPEPGRRVRYVLSGRQPCWHRPPQPPLAAPLAQRQRLFQQLVDSLRHEAGGVLRECLPLWAPGRPLWLCSVPNLAHQFPGQRIAPAVLRRWLGHLQHRHGFDPERDRLLLLDHPKAPPDGSFGALQEPWLAGPLRSSLPLEVLIALLQEARPQAAVRVCGMTSALYGVRLLNGVPVVWLPLLPLWRHNPNYRRKPLEFLHRGLRLARMALLTCQRLPAGGD